MAQFKTDGKFILLGFVGLMIAIVMLSSIGDSIFNQRNTFNQTNISVTAPAINGTLVLTGRQLVAGTTPIVRNSSNIDLQNAGVFISDGIVNGVHTVFMSVNQSGDPNNGTAVNMTYEFRPDGYLDSSADRSVVFLIVLFGALAILVFIVVMLFKFSSLKEIMRLK